MTIGADPAGVRARAVLWGRDHELLGPIATARIAGHVGLAMSCGAQPKPYPTVDANEDVVLAVRAADATLLAVADGSRGSDAAHAAGLALLAEAEPGVTADRATVTRLFTAVDDAMTHMRAHAAGSRWSSRTALTVAVVGAGQVVAATRGDTALVLVRGEECVLVSGVAPTATPAVLPQPQTAPVRPGDLLLVASDGLFDFLGEQWAATVVAATRRGDDALDAAALLVAAACDAGAGDNVSVGLLRVS